MKGKFEFVGFIQFLFRERGVSDGYSWDTACEVMVAESLQRIKKIFFIPWVVFAIVGISFGVFAYINGDLGMHHDLEISDFHICNSPTDLTARVTTISQKDIVGSFINVFACGEIKSGKTESLGIYVYKEPNNKPVYRNRTGDSYSPGELFFPIELRKINSIGDYRVVVYYYRYIVGKASFTITE
jgi:hypothetical protein